MKKPVIIVKDNLLMPILATEVRTNEIQMEMRSVSSPVILNGLFLMLVSYIESMQKEVLTYYLKYQPERIANNNKNTVEIDKQVLIENEDFHFTERLVSEYIDKMPYWQFTEIFYKVLRIKKPDNELSIENIKRRRNELIHSNLEVDFKKGTATHIYIDSDYLAYSLGEYINYLDNLKTEISRRYDKCTKLNALKSLWHYTFRTPLCGNFEDYWHIDIESDLIFAYKISQHEGGLSGSEKFMLGIWRSQVSNYKVDFINMASLGQHMQFCLYMFLKLSNDIFLYQGGDLKMRSKPC
ncbi:MAG: hypothetical protein NTZ04_04420 [Chloroflexi bacterium]|nr:hypothetical protein [Chloroflexota bacterium]